MSDFPPGTSSFLFCCHFRHIFPWRMSTPVPCVDVSAASLPCLFATLSIVAHCAPQALLALLGSQQTTTYSDV